MISISSFVGTDQPMPQNLHLLTLLLYFLFCFVLTAQSQRKIINGKIVSDSLSVNKIHIVNKNLQEGTYTNSFGDFSIPAKVDDTLEFTAVQFQSYKRIVSEIDFQQLQLVIRLNPKNNQLDEVIVKSISVAKGIGLPNADKKPLNRVENRLNAHNKSSTPVVALAALLNQRGGIDNLYYIISGKRKRDRKLRRLKEQERTAYLKIAVIGDIRKHFGDTFFIATVGIPEREIDSYIEYCLQFNIGLLFNEKRLLEMIEIFIRERTAYEQR